jgi:hypothetical protein
LALQSLGEIQTFLPPQTPTFLRFLFFSSNFFCNLFLKLHYRNFFDTLRIIHPFIVIRQSVSSVVSVVSQLLSRIEQSAKTEFDGLKADYKRINGVNTSSDVWRRFEKIEAIYEDLKLSSFANIQTQLVVDMKAEIANFIQLFWVSSDKSYRDTLRSEIQVAKVLRDVVNTYITHLGEKIKQDQEKNTEWRSRGGWNWEGEGEKVKEVEKEIEKESESNNIDENEKDTEIEKNDSDDNESKDDEWGLTRKREESSKALMDIAKRSVFHNLPAKNLYFEDYMNRFSVICDEAMTCCDLFRRCRDAVKSYMDESRKMGLAIDLALKMEIEPFTFCVGFHGSRRSCRRKLFLVCCQKSKTESSEEETEELVDQGQFFCDIKQPLPNGEVAKYTLRDLGSGPNVIKKQPNLIVLCVNANNPKTISSAKSKLEKSKKIHHCPIVLSIDHPSWPPQASVSSQISKDLGIDMECVIDLCLQEKKGIGALAKLAIQMISKARNDAQISRKVMLNSAGSKPVIRRRVGKDEKEDDVIPKLRSHTTTLGPLTDLLKSTPSQQLQESKSSGEAKQGESKTNETKIVEVKSDTKSPLKLPALPTSHPTAHPNVLSPRSQKDCIVS